MVIVAGPTGVGMALERVIMALGVGMDEIAKRRLGKSAT
jgi:hypothetical protein